MLPKPYALNPNPCQAQENESNAQAAQGGVDAYFGLNGISAGFRVFGFGVWVRLQWTVAMILNPLNPKP